MQKEWNMSEWARVVRGTSEMWKCDSARMCFATIAIYIFIYFLKCYHFATKKLEDGLCENGKSYEEAETYRWRKQSTEYARP